MTKFAKEETSNIKEWCFKIIALKCIELVARVIDAGGARITLMPLVWKAKGVK
ncbi:MAG: hypothetical protein IIW92_00580 [Lachnospiraceae bacterium]|nr:hypothetical protein [Lachnospiraceae bacterium]